MGGFRMHFNIRHKKKLLFTCVFILIMAIAFALLLSYASPGMNISKSRDGSVRIITGQLSSAFADHYAAARQNFLEELSENSPGETFSAVVPLDDYYSISEMTELAQDSDLKIERVFMWAPGETGKLVLNIVGNDIDRAIEEYLDRVESRNISHAMAEDLEKLRNGAFGIYGLTITDSPDNLLELSTSVECFVGVDVVYNPAAERYAVSQGKTFSYVERPAKPDGQY